MKQALRMLLAVMVVTLTLSAGEGTLVRAQPPRQSIPPTATPTAALPLPASPTPTAANSGWVARNPLPQGNNLRSVSCPSPNLCVAVGERGTILTSTDGGIRWDIRASNTTQQLNSVSCANGRQCVAVGAGDMILTTSDGGVTWMSQAAGAETDGYSVSCPTATLCVAVYLDVILTSADGGTDWTSHKLGHNQFAAAVSCPSVRVCVIVGAYGTILTSTDGGAGWTSRASGTEQALIGVTCPSVDHCLAVVENGPILITNDGGVTWISRALSGNTDLSEVTCPTVNTCVGVGYAGAVEISADGGATWTYRTSRAGLGLAGVSCSTAIRCVAVGRYGVIVTSVDGGADWTSRGAGTRNLLQGVTCPSMSRCLAVSGTGVLLTSLDGGIRWTTRSSEKGISLSGVTCPSVNRCVGVGIGGAVETSVDGGATWISHISATQRNLTSVSCPTVSLCVAVGIYGVILRSTDGGVSWALRPSGSSWWFYGVSCPSARLCVAVGENGTLLTSADGGINWTGRTSGTHYTLHGVGCPGMQLCVTVGAEGIILESTDGGARWSGRPSGIRDLGLAGISCPSVAMCVVVGGLGIILISTDGGVTWANRAFSTDNGLSAVSCAGISRCVAVGQGGMILQFHAAQGGTSTSVPTTALTSISALSVTAGAGAAYAAAPRGLFRSDNSSFSRWEQVNQVKGITFVSPNRQVSNDLVYATDNGIFRSLDGGRTVTKTSGCKLSSLVRAPSTPSVVYATTLAYKDCPFVTATALYQAIIRSTDDGRSWTLYHQLNDQYEQGTWLGPLAVDPANVGHVVVGENLYEGNASRTIQTLGAGMPWVQGQFDPIGHGQPLAIAFDPVRPNRLWVSWAFGCQGGLYLNGKAVEPGFFTEVAEGYFTAKAPGALAFDPVSARLYIAGLTCRQRVYDGPTQIYTVDASTGTYLTVGKSLPNPGAQAPYLAVTGNGYLLTGGPKTPLTVLKLNGPGIWSRASFLSSAARLLGSPISPPTICHGSPCQYFEKGALLKGGSPLPLVADLLTASAAASLPVGGTTSTITYADLAKLEGTRTPPPAGFQHGVSVGPTGTFVPFSAQLSAKPGYLVPSYFWRFLTNARAVPGGWLHDIGLPLTLAVPATVTKGALGVRTITIQAFQDAVLTYDPLNPSTSQVERANIGSDYATAFPKATR